MPRRTCPVNRRNARKERPAVAWPQPSCSVSSELASSASSKARSAPAMRPFAKAAASFGLPADEAAIFTDSELVMPRMGSDAPSAASCANKNTVSPQTVQPPSMECRL